MVPLSGLNKTIPFAKISILANFTYKIVKVFTWKTGWKRAENGLETSQLASRDLAFTTGISISELVYFPCKHNSSATGTN